MIRTLDDRFLKHIKELKVGDIFQTDRDGTLPWSPWFFALTKPKVKRCLHPRPSIRWSLDSTPILEFFGLYLFKCVRAGRKDKIKQLARILRNI